jgi:CBS domain-containing protein
MHICTGWRISTQLQGESHMLTVQHILQKKGPLVQSIDADASVLDAALLMNQFRIGCLVVTKGKAVIGIFTERDILCRIVANETSPRDTRIGEVMTAPVAVCTPETPLAECRAVMREKRIRHLPVVKDEQLIGMLSIGDILAESEQQQAKTIQFMYEYMHGGSGSPAATNV